MNRAMNSMTSAIRQQASMAGNSRTKPRLCEISSYDPNAHAVKVMREPQHVESNWMPLGAIGIGNGWGVAVGPEEGDQVMVEFEEDDPEGGVIVARVFSVQQRAPAIPPGEIWAIHKAGSFLKFLTNGDVVVNTIGNLVANVGSDLTATVAGDMTASVTGDASTTAANASVTASGQATVTAPSIKLGKAGQALRKFVTDAFLQLFNSHTHTTQGLSSPTSVPNQQMDTTQLTTTVTGG